MLKNCEQNNVFIFDRPYKFNLGYLKQLVLWMIKSCLANITLALFPRNWTKKKYNISICAIFKNEAPFMKEWLEYHILIGVEHFYLYNNNSDDNYREVLSPYISNGIVSLTEWPEIPGQMTSYKHWYENFREETNWVSFLDLDEFICPRYELNIPAWLEKFKRYPVVMIYWKMFGTSGVFNHDYNRLVTEQYTISWEKLVNIGKLFYNTEYDIECFHVGMMHSFNVNYHGVSIPPVNQFGYFVANGIHRGHKNENEIQVNHYWSKSYKCYTAKHKRGDASFIQSPRDFEYFLWHENHNISSDYSIYRFLVQLKLKLQ